LRKLPSLCNRGTLSLIYVMLAALVILNYIHIVYTIKIIILLNNEKIIILLNNKIIILLNNKIIILLNNILIARPCFNPNSIRPFMEIMQSLLFI
jgi:hypothetical protein